MMLKRTIIIIIALILCLTLLGCSSSTQFFVVNNSNSTIEIEYIVTSKVDTVEHTATKPYKMFLSDWDSWFRSKKELEVPQNEYEFDSKLHKVKVKLNPNEVLRIAIALHHESVLNTENYEFPIESLHLSGDKGEIIYNGKQFYKQFEKKDDNKYFVSYK